MRFARPSVWLGTTGHALPRSVLKPSGVTVVLGLGRLDRCVSWEGGDSAKVCAVEAASSKPAGREGCRCTVSSEGRAWQIHVGPCGQPQVSPCHAEGLPVLSSGVCGGAGVRAVRSVVTGVLLEGPGQGLTAGFPTVAGVSQAGVYGTRGQGWIWV